MMKAFYTLLEQSMSETQNGSNQFTSVQLPGVQRTTFQCYKYSTIVLIVKIALGGSARTQRTQSGIPQRQTYNA
jgi:hypothetical protein